MMALIVSILLLAMVVSAVLVLRRSAKKFDLSAEQLQRIKKRNEQLDEQERQDKAD